MTKLKLGTLALCMVASALIDGTTIPPNQTGPGRIATEGFPRCYEDEMVVSVVAAFDGRDSFDGHQYGDLVCVPYDDINKGTRPEDR